MITAIFTAEATKLTIETSEAANLEQMGADSIRLKAGSNTISVAAGVFKVVSKLPVRVTSDSASTNIQATTNNKDGTFPDQTNLVKISADRDATQRFFADAKSMTVPR